MSDLMREGSALAMPADGCYDLPLSAGRDLDARIAEKVMKHLLPFSQHPVGCPDGRPGCCVMHYDTFDATGLRIPHYSTDIAAAWLVVDAMQKRAFVCEITVDCYSDGKSAGVDAWFWQFKTKDDADEVHAETAPLAICRAALAAVEGIA